MAQTIHSFGAESHISGIHELTSGIGYYHDNTAHVLISATSLETAGAASTAVAIIDLSKYSDNILYVDSTNGPGANAGTTGLTIFFEARALSAGNWSIFKTDSGVNTTGGSITKIAGSGNAAYSGITHFGDIRITIQNTTDSSGTATINAYVLSRTPN